ncbi:MAG: VWA domain-containing protein [Planctomycetes bacterium]|nr:VWA domain-containing protein [Planctomycetota bacterium]
MQGKGSQGQGTGGGGIGRGLDDLVKAGSNPNRTPRDERSPERRGRTGPADGSGSDENEPGGDPSDPSARKPIGTNGARDPNASKPSKGTSKPTAPEATTGTTSTSSGDSTTTASKDKATGSTRGDGLGDAKAKQADTGTPTGIDEGAKERARSAPAAAAAPVQEKAPSPADPSDATGNAPEGDPDLPELEVDRLDGDAEALKRAGQQRGEVVQHPLHGTWIQESTGSTADFGIGGYSQSLMSIDMIGGVVTVLRVVPGTAPMVMAGEFRITSPARAAGTLDGECALSLDPSLTSRFPARGGSVGGATFEAPSGTGPWVLQWKRETNALQLGSKRYVPCDPSRFESLRRDGPDPAAAERARQARQAAAAASPESKRATKVSTFMGVKGGGSRFMYIIDVSGSMGASWGNTTKFEHAKAELIKAIEALPAGTEFCVAFFTDGAGALKDGWLEAGVDTKAAVERIRQQGLMGGTDPLPALQFAFESMDPIPDCIFILTDGLIPTDVPDRIRDLNDGATITQINTLGFDDSPQAIAILEQIADDNEGEFRLVR